MRDLFEVLQIKNRAWFVFILTIAGLGAKTNLLAGSASNVQTVGQNNNL